MTDPTVSDFADSIGALRRATRRIVRMSLGSSTTLTTAEVELLLLVRRQPGIGVGEAARVLVTAPNTISTLVTNLSRAGLLDRTSDPDDKRAARLDLTESGQTLVVTLRRRRLEVLEDAFRMLGPAERTAIEAAIPAIRHLIERLDSIGAEL